MNAYVDTSVLGAYYCPEALSAAAEGALRGLEVPVISGLSGLEFCSLIAKKRRLKELTAQQAQKTLVSACIWVHGRNLVVLGQPCRAVEEDDTAAVDARHRDRHHARGGDGQRRLVRQQRP